jgi:hypothetical protein
MSGPRVLYGDVMLEASDAYDAAVLDIEYGHACRLEAFDPSDPARLMVQDQLVAEGVLSVDFSDGWRLDWTDHPAGDDLVLRTITMILAPESIARRHTGDDDSLADFLGHLRNAVTLPLDAMHDDIARLLEFAVLEAHRRVRVVARVERSGDRYEDWQTVDLLAAIEAVAGSGKRRGRAWWFSCPFHTERTPSLEVDPERRLWHCFGCGAGGGVVDWRKRIEGVA